MTGHPAVELLSSYLDSEVTPAELRLVEGHLEECSECRRTVAGLRAVSEGVRRLEAVAPPESLARSVQHGVARASLEQASGFGLEESLRRWMAQPVLAPLFAIVLALGTIVYLFAFGVARDESRGTRLVIASAPEETRSGTIPEAAPVADAGLSESLAAEAEPAPAVAERKLSREIASAPVPPARLEESDEFAEETEPASTAEAEPAPAVAERELSTEMASAPAPPATLEEPAEFAEVIEPASTTEVVPAPELERMASVEPSEPPRAAAKVAGARSAQRQAEQRLAAISDSEADETAAPREVSGRRFFADGPIWIEEGLADAAVDEVLDLRRDADREDAQLEAFRELGRVRLRVDDRVVEVVYPESASPDR